MHHCVDAIPPLYLPLFVPAIPQTISPHRLPTSRPRRSPSPPKDYVSRFSFLFSIPSTLLQQPNSLWHTTYLTLARTHANSRASAHTHMKVHAYAHTPSLSYPGPARPPRPPRTYIPLCACTLTHAPSPGQSPPHSTKHQVPPTTLLVFSQREHRTQKMFNIVPRCLPPAEGLCSRFTAQALCKRQNAHLCIGTQMHSHRTEAIQPCLF